MREEIYKIQEAIVEDVNKKLEDEFYSSQIYNLGAYDIAQDAIMEYLNKILTDEKVKAKLVNTVSKAVRDKQKSKEAARKAERARDTQLWNATKGKIPCLNQCGYFQQKTKEEVMTDGNNFICASCCKKLDKEDHFATFNIFSKRNVYAIYNIK